MCAASARDATSTGLSNRSKWQWKSIKIKPYRTQIPLQLIHTTSGDGKISLPDFRFPW